MSKSGTKSQRRGLHEMSIEWLPKRKCRRRVLAKHFARTFDYKWK
jgi:hypothetical protein